MVNLTQSLAKPEITFSKAVLLFYLLIGSSFLKDLYSGQLVELVSDSRLAQHIIGFITMLVVIILYGETASIFNATVYAVVAYAWFIGTTKLDLQWNLAIIILLLIGFLYEAKLFDKESNTVDDEALSYTDKKKIKDKNDKIRGLIMLSIVIVTLLGAFSYYNKKQIQYGGSFDPVKFVFGGRNLK